MTTWGRLIIAAAAALLATGCGAVAGDATTQAERLAEEVDGARVLTITEANDEFGFYDAKTPPKSVAVIHMPGQECAKVNFICGATVEISDRSAEDTMRESRLVVAMLKDGGQKDMWMWVKGNAVLTVSNRLEAVDRAVLAGAFDGEPAF